MPFPGNHFRNWKKEDVDALVADPPAVETARRDFKADCRLLSSDREEREKARRDILKDIAAMANAGGGALLIGVRQSGKAGDPPIAVKIESIEKDSVERLKQSIDALVATHLDVRPGPLDYWTVPYDAERVVLVVDVPANTYSLSMVTYEQLNQFWVRRGTDNRPMTTDEIQYQLGRSAKIREDALGELNRIRSFFQSKKKPLVWMAGVPVARARDHIPVKIEPLRAALEDSCYFRLCPKRKSESGRYPGLYLRQVRPSVAGLTYAEDEDNSITLEVRRDGTVVFGCQLIPVRETDRRGQRMEFALTWMIYEPLLSGLCMLHDIQRVYGLSQLAVVQGGIMGVQGWGLARGQEFEDRLFPRLFREGTVDFDATLLNENWIPKDCFFEWAEHLANAVEEETSIPCLPWVPDVSVGGGDP